METFLRIIGAAVVALFTAALLVIPYTWCTMIALGILYAELGILAPIGFGAAIPVTIALILIGWVMAPVRTSDDD